ncbi:MAG: SRPBCC domain-containing protein [Chloroflexi bacterium]|nr:SRPBCC domain-containing protein [Chloroflexota bacterium]
MLGSLRSTDGKGVVRIEDRFDTEINDLWSALTDPDRLARWLGQVEGDLRLGGEFRATFFASGWEGTGRIEACEPRRQLLVRTQHVRAPYDLVTEVTLTADGDQAILVLEERGMPLDQLAAYGAGDQIHVEDLANFLAGRELRDPEARWDELEGAYRDLANNLGVIP